LIEGETDDIDFNKNVSFIIFFNGKDPNEVCKEIEKYFKNKTKD